MKATHRERIKTALRFERPDRLPCHETPWEQTLAAWREQGLPPDADLAEYFDFDLCFMYMDASPRFEQKVLAHEAGHITYEDRFGYTIRKPEGISSTLQFLSHKNRDRKAWERIRPRFVLDPLGPARIDDRMYFGHFDAYPAWDEALEKYRRLYARGRYMLFMVYGPWEATWRHRGMEKLLLDVAADPEWVREMADAYQDLVIDALDHSLHLGMKPDGILAADDLGLKTGPLMSPKSWERIFMPAVSRLGSFVKKNGIDFWMHSDGAMAKLIDPILECGVKVLNPLEVKAGMDAVDLRKQYGNRLAFFGNIDATKMAGPLAVIEEELARKIPLAREGGYIMHSDHSCPPQVSFERYDWILKTSRDIFNGSS